jgi:hypothetical protein
MTIGITALPVRPMALKRRSMRRIAWADNRILKDRKQEERRYDRQDEGHGIAYTKVMTPYSPKKALGGDAMGEERR